MENVIGAKRHVVILVENLSVPTDRRVWQQALALTASGVEVSVVCPRGETRDREPYALLEGVRIFRYPARHAASGIASYAREYGSALKEMRRLVRQIAAEHRVDVVHASNPPDVLLLAALSTRRAGAAFIFDQHDLVPEMTLSHFAGNKVLYRATLGAERLSYRLSDVVLVTTESYRDVALTRGRKRAEDVFVVRNAPDLSFFRPVEPDPELRKGARFVIGYMGIVGHQDGVDHTLRALAVLKGRRSDWRGVFVGEGEALDEMRHLSRRLGVDELVEFTGWRSGDELVSALSTFDVCVAPNPKTPLNDVSTMVKLLEYMAMSKPVAAYDLRETRRVAADAAAYAAVDDPSSLADAIERLLDDPELAARMGALGRERIETVLSREEATKQLLAAYDRAYAAADAKRR
jgi:glycosyltransferase involved in cell wall biosynthesis